MANNPSNGDQTNSPEPAAPQTDKPKADATSGAELGADQVQDAFDQANEQGYFGTVPDETPNEAYTVEGVVKAAEDAKDGK